MTAMLIFVLFYLLITQHPDFWLVQFYQQRLMTLDYYVDHGQDPTGYLLYHFKKTAILIMARTPHVICYLTLRKLLC